MKTLEEAIGTDDPEGAVAALVEASAKARLADLARDLATAGLLRLDIDRPPVPAHLHPYQALAAAATLSTLMPRDLLLPLAQAAGYLARSPKREPHRAHEARIVGEEVHLANSLLLEIRRGGTRDAERLLGGLLGARERVQVGDLLFQGAAEDSVHGGHKLSVATLGWALARHVGWRAHAALVLWPAIHYVASGPRDTAASGIASAAVGKGVLDLEAVGKNFGHLQGETSPLRKALAAGDAEGAATAAVAALKAGVGGDAVLDEAALHLGLALVHGSGDDAVHALAYLHGARFALGFSRSGHRLLPAIQAAVLAARVPSKGLDLPAPAKVGDAVAARNELHLAIAGGDEAEAVALVTGYVDAGADANVLVGELAREAGLVDAHATGGHSLVLAHAAIQEYRHSRGRERWLALAGLAAWLARCGGSREVAESLGVA